MPLLGDKHKLPMDSRVVRQVFHSCYHRVTGVAIAASIGHALAGRPLLSACTGGIALNLTRPAAVIWAVTQLKR